MPLAREAIFPEPELPNGHELLAEGRAMARDWSVGPSLFLRENGVDSEFAYKRRQMERGIVMQHAQIGYRDLAKSCRAYARIWEACLREGVDVDRYGLCLDWSMAIPRAARSQAVRGTGMILPDVEDFARLANSAPVAAHFGDFVLGFPAALENTQAALAAGSTAIGNLGQYFTFRVPGHDDDVEATRSTVLALGLIAAQPVPVMVHSNIDDGFAAQFTDLTTCLGMILLERDILTRLVGAPIGHCYGHHFSDPLARLAFQRALAIAGAEPGTVIYGNTTAYRGNAAQNFSGLSSYLLVDIVGQATRPTGHAINPVPVTENERIPDIEEVVDAQLFAGRLRDHAGGWLDMIATGPVDELARRIVSGAERFFGNTMRGLAQAGVDTDDCFEMLLALRRIGARRLEAAFGAGQPDKAAPGGRAPMIPATIMEEIIEMADASIAAAPAIDSGAFSGVVLMVATSDVHEHGKMVIEEMGRRLGMTLKDGGVSTDPEKLAQLASEHRPDAIAISTYNGIALSYCRSLRKALDAAGLSIPLIVGGRLNQILDGSNSSLPVDVGDKLAEEGVVVCRAASDLVPALARIAGSEAPAA